MADDEDPGRWTAWFSMSLMPAPPRFPLAVATAVTGLLCGLAATLMVWGGEHGCDAVRGRPSCGQGYGLLMLLAIVVGCFALGAFLLSVFAVDGPVVTAFFGVSLPLLVILGLLLDHVFDAGMAVALPVLVAVCFVASTYLTRALEAANPTADVDSTQDDRAADPLDAAQTDDPDPADPADDDPGAEALPRYAPSDDG